MKKNWKLKKNNVYEQMKLMGYEIEYVKKYVVFFLLMNYDK